MKENIDVIVVYNLVDSNGTKLQLRLGRYKYSEDYLPDKGFRWSFVGSKIPMPVRAYTWFNGFPENIMLDWLKGNGWALARQLYVSCLSMTNPVREMKIPLICLMNATGRHLRMLSTDICMTTISLWQYDCTAMLMAEVW